MKREQPNYLRLRGKNGEVVAVDLRTGKAYVENTQPKRRDEARIQRRHESTARLMRQLDEEREESLRRNQKPGCFCMFLLPLALGILLASIPGRAYACSGWIDCWLGISSTVEIRQTEQTERERIAAERDADVARIQAEAQERVRQADAEVERIRQMQYQSEADRDIAIAQANAKAEEYKAMIAGLTSEKITGIQSNADSQIAALQAQAQIAIAGINQTGETERWRIGGGWTFAVVAVVVAGLILLAIIRSGGLLGAAHPQSTVVLLANPGQFPQIESRVKEIEVQHAKRYLSQN